MRNIALFSVSLGMGIIFLLIGVFKHKELFETFYSGTRTLWFLIVIFECLVFYLIMQGKNSWLWSITTFIIPIPLAIVIGRLPLISHLWPHVDQFTYLWPIFVLGAYLSKYRFTHLHINWKWSIFLVLFVIMFLLFKPSWYVYRLPLNNTFYSIYVDIFRTIAAICGCGATLFIIKYLHPLIGKFTIVRNIGQSTLPLYVLQTLLFLKYTVINTLLSDKLNYVHAIFLSCIILVGLYVFYRATRRIPFIASLLYGENNKTIG